MMKMKKIALSLLMVLLIMLVIPVNVYAFTTSSGIWDFWGVVNIPGIGCQIRDDRGHPMDCSACQRVTCKECGGVGEHKLVGNLFKDIWGIFFGSHDYEWQFGPCHNKNQELVPPARQKNAIGIFSKGDIVTISNIFCPITYASSFTDLRNAFGDGKHFISAAKLWNHFYTYALSGREPARLNSFSPVFRADHYLKSYADLRAAAWVNNDNNTGALLHFSRFGMNEARNSHPNFNVQNYKVRYIDLQKSFGNQWNMYYRHYVRHGLSEGRIPN